MQWEAVGFRSHRRVGLVFFLFLGIWHGWNKVSVYFTQITKTCQYSSKYYGQNLRNDHHSIMWSSIPQGPYLLTGMFGITGPLMHKNKLKLTFMLIFKSKFS